MTCPIAFWKKQSANQSAFSTLSYEELDNLVARLTSTLSQIQNSLLAFIPQETPQGIAFFFAAWRLGKTLYPLNPRLPEDAIKKRIEGVNAAWVEIEQLEEKAPLEIETISSTFMALYVETSSATKIACHRYQSLQASAEATSLAMGIEKNSRYCLNLPLFHIAGIASMLRTFIRGATLLFREEKEIATHLSMVPTQLYRHLQNPLSLPHLKCLLVGGGPLSPSLYDEAIRKDLPIVLTYAMTEAGSTIGLKFPHSPTKILPHLTVKLAPDGEILIQGSSLFEGYYGQEKRDPHDWFRTKDLGRWEPNGDLTLVGRKDRQFISGGENIQPEEIEHLLLKFPHILDARVEPSEDEEFGMCPFANIYVEKPVSLEELRSYLEKRLPRFKVPKKLNFSSTPLKTTKLSQE